MTYLHLTGCITTQVLGVVWSFAWPKGDSYILALGFLGKRSIRIAFHLKDRIGDPRWGSEWEPIKILSQKNSAYIPIATLRVTHEQVEAHTNLTRDLRNKA
jgi:hypothetical protein